MKKCLVLVLPLVVPLLLGPVALWHWSRGNPPPDALLGKWQDPTRREGIEFAKNGALTIVRAEKNPLRGKYCFLEEGLMEVDLRPAVAEPVHVKVSLGGEQLMLTALLAPEKRAFKEEWPSTWKRVPDWTLAAESPDPGPVEQRRQGLIGRWQSVTDFTTYDFYDDRTFAAYTKALLPVFKLGTFHLDPDSGHGLTCRYPDTGTTERLYLSLDAEELVIGREHAECPLVLLRATKTYRRAGGPTAAYRPLRPDALTAYQLLQEWQTNPAAAEKKYQGKEVQLVGCVGMAWANRAFVMWRDEQGKRQERDPSYAALFLTTGASQDVVCRFDGRANADRLGKLFLDSPFNKDMDRQEWPRNKPIIIKGQCVGLTKDLGPGPTLGGDPLKIRLDHCSLVTDPPMPVSCTRGNLLSAGVSAVARASSVSSSATSSAPK